jgi:hypothetical protein
VLIVSPHFPPTNAPDHQRARMSLPHFREFGWSPTVLAVDAAHVESPRDPLLAATLPPDVPVIRVGALPVRLTRLAGLGNLGYRAWFTLSHAGTRLLRQQRFDLVYFSTTQWISTLLGRQWRRRFSVPFVIDVQDPWRTDYYERSGAPTPPGGWKYRFARWQANRLEARAWREAAGFVSVSPVYLDQLNARYAWFQAKPTAVIPFGASEADFDFVRRHPEIPDAVAREAGTLKIVCVGAIGSIMRPAIETLFAGLARWRARVSAPAARIKLHFVGTSYAPAGHAVPSVQPLADALGVGDLVAEQTSRVGYFTAIQTLLGADALLLPGSNDPGYSPSRIGPCFLARKPVLALVTPGNAAEKRIRSLDFARLAEVGSADAPHQVAMFLDDLLRAPSRLAGAARAEEKFLAEDSARACTRQQCELFDRALFQGG